MKFVVEVPRFFTYLEAKDADEAKTILKEEVNKFVDENAVISDVTDKEIPSAQEAQNGPKNSGWHKIISIFETGKAISKAVGGTPYLGIGDGDIMISRQLGEMLGMDVPETTSFMSLGGIFGAITPDKTPFDKPKKTA